MCVVKVLLRCDKGVANYSDRTLLKNLGHWLGLLTLAKNKPILFREMDVKGLIYESYHKGAQELLYVIPFVAKIIESAAKSRVCACFLNRFSLCVNFSAVSALTLLVGWQEGKGIRPVENRVVGYWRGYLSGARCRLAYGPADATATHCLLLQ